MKGRILITAVISILLTVSLCPSPAPVKAATATGWLEGETGRILLGDYEWYKYDFDSEEAVNGNVDWPVSIMFYGDEASVANAKAILWEPEGSDMHMSYLHNGTYTWVGDKGRKSTGGDSDAWHVRLYAASNDKTPCESLGYYVIGTTHRDWTDNSCYGYTQFATAAVLDRAAETEGYENITQHFKYMYNPEPLRVEPGFPYNHVWFHDGWAGGVKMGSTPGPGAEVFYDGFENGLTNWQDSQNAWEQSSQQAKQGMYSVEVHGPASDATLTLSNAINLSSAACAILTFSWRIGEGLDTDEYLALDIGDGTTWDEVARLRGNVDPEDIWVDETIWLDHYLISNFKLRFRGTMSESDEYANVDEVKITAKETVTVTYYPTYSNPARRAGYIERRKEAGGELWAAMWGASDGTAIVQGSGGTITLCGFSCYDISPKFRSIARGLFAYPTENLPDNAIITHAVVKIWGGSKLNYFTGTSPAIGLYTTTGVNPTNFVLADYSKLGTVLISNKIAYADWNTAVFNSFELNAAGIAFISKTQPTVFGIREANYEAANAPPAWHAGWAMTFSGYAYDMTAHKARLVITYALP